jgi:hypothetical protein
MIAQRGKSERHIQFCLSGDFQAALAASDSDLLVQETANTLAVLGNISLAIDVARGALRDHERRKGVLLVIAIECARRPATENLQELMRDLEKEGLTAWDRIQLALGFSQRQPWDIYPYPDY